jgi:predicted RNA-binding protein with PUA-like domain
VQFGCVWAEPLSLHQLRLVPELEQLALLRKGNRLSLMPLTANEWQAIMAAGHQG